MGFPARLMLRLVSRFLLSSPLVSSFNVIAFFSLQTSIYVTKHEFEKDGFRLRLTMSAPKFLCCCFFGITSQSISWVRFFLYFEPHLYKKWAAPFTTRLRCRLLF